MFKKLLTVGAAAAMAVATSAIAAETWQVYLTKENRHIVSVRFNAALGQSSSALNGRMLVSVSVPMKQPREDGLRSQTEFDALAKLEDQLAIRVEQSNGLPLGAKTGKGQSEFFFALPSNTNIEDVLSQIVVTHGYKAQVDSKANGAARFFSRELFPDDKEQEWIANLSVFENIWAYGDTGQDPRHIRYFAYFPSTQKASSFARLIEKHGFSVEEIGPIEQDTKVLFSHFRALDIWEMTETTFWLASQAEKRGGVYDGWEAQVVKPDQ